MKIDSAPRSDTLPRPEPPAPDAPDATVTSSLEMTEAAVKPEAVTAPETMAASAVPVTPSRAPGEGLSRRARLVLGAGILALVGLFLFKVLGITRPFIWAAVVAYILNPIVCVVQRRLHVRRGIGVAVVMLALLGLVAWGLVSSVPTLRNDVVALSDQVNGIDSYMTTYLPNAGTVMFLGVQINVPQLVANIQKAIDGLPGLILHDVFSVATGVVETLLRLLTFLLSTVYLLLDGPRLGIWLRSRVPARYRDDSVGLTTRVNTVLSEYLRAEVILILIMSTASFIALTVLGMRFAIVLAPIVGFLEIFPIIGPFFAIGLVTVVALISPPNYNLSHVGYALVVAAVFFVLRQLEDYLVIPTVVGHAVKLHPVLVLFALLCGASLGGILGMFLAVPVTGALKVMGSFAYDHIVAPE